ncbi:hypothetical protein [Hymenobacter bucti]|uniref:DUF4292 domain-containing protein n=1 Tax=Hymenobacter bucti TaxID=1844114 RepID=A0ABW4R1A8_9BACT
MHSIINAYYYRMLTISKKASYLLFILFAGGVLISCGKKDPEPETPGFRLFTKQLEITDAAVKANFLKRSTAMFQTVSAIGPTDKIVFIKPDTAKFTSYYSFHYSVMKKGNQYLFYSPPVVQVAYNTELIRDMQKYTAPKVPVPGYLDIAYVTQEVRVGYGDTKQLEMPYIQYYWKRAAVAIRGPYKGVIFNELNDGVASNMIGLDTLAVKTGSISVPVQ